MTSSRLRIPTPLGDLTFIADWAIEAGAQISLVAIPFQPTLPQGMSVSACFAILLQVPEGETEAEVNFSASLQRSVPVKSGAKTGQELEAQEWRSEQHLVLVGTEDAECLQARLQDQVGVSNNSFVYEPNLFSLTFIRMPCNTPLSVHFLAAWNELPERQDCSCWYAVDQPHVAVVDALMANTSLGRRSSPG